MYDHHLEIIKHSLNLRPTTYRGSNYYLASLLSVLRGGAPEWFKDSPQKSRYNYLLLKGQQLAEFKKVFNGPPLGSINSLYVINESSLLDFLESYPEFPSESKMQDTIMKLASYTPLHLRQEVSLISKDTSVRIDIVDKTNNTIIELKNQILMPAIIKATLAKKYQQLYKKQYNTTSQPILLFLAPSIHPTARPLLNSSVQFKPAIHYIRELIQLIYNSNPQNSHWYYKDIVSKLGY